MVKEVYTSRDTLSNIIGCDCEYECMASNFDKHYHDILDDNYDDYADV